VRSFEVATCYLTLIDPNGMEFPFAAEDACWCPSQTIGAPSIKISLKAALPHPLKMPITISS